MKANIDYLAITMNFTFTEISVHLLLDMTLIYSVFEVR